MTVNECSGNGTLYPPFDNVPLPETASGQAEFEPYTRELRIPPPAQTGYHDLELPALGIRSGVVVNEPFFGAPDEYFAIDSLFSWGAARK